MNPMVIDTTIRTPRDCYLAAYCLMSTDRRDAFLARVEKIGIDAGLRLAADEARDAMCEAASSTRRYEVNARAWEIVEFVENF